MRGYELLYRGSDTGIYDGTDPDQASVQLISNSMLVNQLRELTGGLPAFINVSEGLLQQDLLEVLPPAFVVVELLETIRPTPRVIAAVRRLKQSGYRIALDDFIGDPSYAPLIQLADIIKVDFLLTDAAQRRAIVEEHRREGLAFLAEKVETHEEFREARDSGFELFQGYFFCKPETLMRREMPRTKVRYLEFLREMSRPDIDLERLEQVIRSEPSLSGKLLRYLNSAHFSLRIQIDSIKQALSYLGERPLKRWATLVALTGLGDDKPQEIVTTCLIRAHFCEAMARPVGVGNHELDLFLTGMFSAVDALVDRPLEEVLAEIGVSQKVLDAIAGNDTSMSRIYALVRATELGDQGEFDRLAQELDVSSECVTEAYTDAVLLTQRLMGLSDQEPASESRAC